MLSTIIIIIIVSPQYQTPFPFCPHVELNRRRVNSCLIAPCYSSRQYSVVSNHPPGADGDEWPVVSSLGPVEERCSGRGESTRFTAAGCFGADPSDERQSAARSLCMSEEQRLTGYIITQLSYNTQYQLTTQPNIRKSINRLPKITKHLTFNVACHRVPAMLTATALPCFIISLLGHSIHRIGEAPSTFPR